MNLCGSPLQRSFLCVQGKFITILEEGISTLPREITSRKIDNPPKIFFPFQTKIESEWTTSPPHPSSVAREIYGRIYAIII